MTRGTLIRSAIAVVIVVATVLAIRGSGNEQTVRVPLQTAGGLRVGSQVKVGGVPVGKIAKLRLGTGDVPIATLNIDRTKAKIGPGASAQVVTSNLLGSKFLSLEPGTGDGNADITIPASRVTYPVDLDQVLDTLDADTRTRAAILINELGYAATGRRADFSAAMRLLPQDLTAGADLLQNVAADNASLGRLVDEAGRTVHTYNGQREQLVRLIDNFGKTLQTTADKRAELARTLDDAPSTLRTAQVFLADLQNAAAPLKPAADTLAGVAPALDTTLTQVPGFTAAARPALDQAITDAPALTRLADGATPVLQQAAPTLRSVAQFGSDATPLVGALRVSVDDLLGLAEGWARAIQTRDGFGHVFRGRLTLGPETLRNLLSSEGAALPVKRRRTPGRGQHAPAPTQPVPPAPQATPAPGVPTLLQALTQGLKLPDLNLPEKLKPVTGVLDGVAGNTKGLLENQKPLLDYLLGDGK